LGSFLAKKIMKGQRKTFSKLKKNSQVWASITKLLKSKRWKKKQQKTLYRGEDLDQPRVIKTPEVREVFS